MAEYEKELTGCLFRNKQKEDGDKKPDYTGNVTVESVEYRLAAWIREGKTGKFMSLKLTAPDEQYTRREQPSDDSMGELPF